MAELDKILAEENAKLEAESLKRIEQERIETQKREQERKEMERLARKAKTKKVICKILHPFKGKRVAKNAAKIVAVKKEQRKRLLELQKKREADFKREEALRIKTEEANAEIVSIKAMYDPAKVGTVEVSKREDPKYTYGGKLVPDHVTTTVVHTPYGPLVKEEMHNPYAQTSHPYYVKYYGFAKTEVNGIEQIVYIHQEAHLVWPNHAPVELIEHNYFTKYKNGQINFNEYTETIYGRYNESDVHCGVEKYFNEQLAKNTTKETIKE